jgi:glyoxylase-like metal-dependent hydrolase (beta-lactamase superfamily II)/8-oxo-dGTP pyrophosphatase MutT (NUDIX family)
MSELIAGLPPPPPPVEPRVAAAVILWRDGPRGREVFWVKRLNVLRFAGGFYAFPGGALDEEDGRAAVPGLSGRAAALAACATREVFEETGILLTAGPRLPREVRAAARRALLEGTLDFGAFLERHGLSVDRGRLVEAGRWITPAHAPYRYDATVFVTAAPVEEEAEVWPGELTEGSWVVAAEAVERWSSGEVLLHPPNLWGLQCLAAAAPPACVERLRNPPGVEELVSRRIEFQRGLFLAPVRTPTLPPATHTNCWILDLGGGALALVDPGSPYLEEQARLERVLADLAEEGLRPGEIWLTHHHADHVGGVAALLARHEGLVVRLHRETAARLPQLDGGDRAGAVRLASDGDALPGGWRAVFTPGHAPGHLAFLNERSRALLAGDMVSTLSTIVIDPPDGDMAEYLRSLERLRDLGPRALFPAHGAPTQDGVGKLREYLVHRRERERKVVDALDSPGTLEEVTARAYDDTPAFMLPVAARSCLASLQKLERDGRARREGERWMR